MIQAASGSPDELNAATRRTTASATESSNSSGADHPAKGAWRRAVTIFHRFCGSTHRPPGGDGDHDDLERNRRVPVAIHRESRSVVPDHARAVRVARDALVCHLAGRQPAGGRTRHRPHRRRGRAAGTRMSRERNHRVPRAPGGEIEGTRPDVLAAGLGEDRHGSAELAAAGRTLGGVQSAGLLPDHDGRAIRRECDPGLRGARQPGRDVVELGERAAGRAHESVERPVEDGDDDRVSVGVDGDVRIVGAGAEGRRALRAPVERGDPERAARGPHSRLDEVPSRPPEEQVLARVGHRPQRRDRVHPRRGDRHRW